jgi:molybdopterin synthase catalytic subunit
MTVRITLDPLEPWQEIAAYQQHLGQAGRFGATVVFVGTMRDFNKGEAIQEMELEHYPGMTERSLHKIITEAKHRWPVFDCLIVHRCGNLQPNEPIMLAAVWSAHRPAAFNACRYLVEELKSQAPLWKKETLVAGTRWVEPN